MKSFRIAAIALLATVCAAHAAIGADQEWPLNFTLKDLHLGKTVYGEEWKPEQLANHVVLVEMWGINCGPCLASLPKLSAWQQEYEKQGLVIIGGHRQQASDESLKALAERKELSFTILNTGDVEGAEFRGIPHCFLFDSSGKCVYRGHPSDVLEPMKDALAKAPFAALGGRELVKLSSMSEALKSGTPPARVLQKAENLTGSDDAEVADEAKYVVEKLTTWGTDRIASAKAKKTEDPMKCLQALQEIEQEFAGTAVAETAAEEIAQLKNDPAFQKELEACKVLAKIKYLDDKVKPLRGGDTSSNDFKRENYNLLKNIRLGALLMQKKYPDSKATQQAVEIAEKYKLLKD